MKYATDRCCIVVGEKGLACFTNVAKHESAYLKSLLQFCRVHFELCRLKVVKKVAIVFPFRKASTSIKPIKLYFDWKDLCNFSNMHFCIKQPITPTAAKFNHAHPWIVKPAR